MFRIPSQTLAAIFVCFLGSQLRADEIPPFPPHPRLATTAAELARLKESPARKDQAVRLAEALLIIGCTGIGGGNIGSRFFQCAYGASTALSQYCRQRLVHQHCINKIKQSQQDRGRYGSEQ